MTDAYPVSKLKGITTCSFDHLQFFVDDLKPLEHYKAMEDRLNKFAAKCPFKFGWDLDAARKAWCEMGPSADPSEFQVHGRDLVEQQLHGVGWRITGQYEGAETRSLLLSTPDPNGVRFVITAANDASPAKKAKADLYDHFSASHMKRYFKYHNGAQGVAVLGFQLAPGEIEIVAERYKQLHPKLLLGSPHTYEGGVRTLDVFAYYLGEKGVSEADSGTVLRFVERPPTSDGSMPLPGLTPVAAEFDPTVLPAYADHWVSNVKSRVGFLQTLEDTLGFVPKVDFNAGVVAAGEAQIESTVMGNASPLVTTDPKAALTDRGQIFLPTNNALSPVGHVHWYLEELGQGIQHVASRVGSLTEYIQRANDMRAITGEGHTFLNIPRTYYGLLDTALLTKGGVSGELLGECPSGLSDAEAEEVMEALGKAGLMDLVGAVDLDADDAACTRALLAGTRFFADAPAAKKAMILRVVRRSCYVNLWKLMKDQLSEQAYLKVVRNKILADVQGEDVLFQIFTSTILQRKPGTEAPFLEFIERVCSQKDGHDTCEPIRPGCGGFGIRNFLTLFLSIEVSKAMLDMNKAIDSGAEAEAAFHKRRVQLFTDQLVESNPILTEISDCMTGEGNCLDKNDTAGAQKWTQRKEAANDALQKCSEKYNALMKKMREAGW